MKDERTYKIIGAALEVHKELGCGFLEAVYQEALGELSGIEEAQLINYLKATKLKTGLLINFGNKSLEYKRLVHGFQSAQICVICGSISAQSSFIRRLRRFAQIEK